MKIKLIIDPKYSQLIWRLKVVKSIKCKCILIFSLLFCFYMCNSNLKKEERVLEIDISSLSKIESLKYGDSKYFKSSKIIKLEGTDDASLIGEIGQVEVFDDKIYLLESLTSCLLIFDIDGSYLGKIGQKGAGPGEYLNILSFYIDEKEATINIIDNQNSAIIQYNISGHFLRKIKHNNRDLNFVKKARVVDDKLFCYSVTSWQDNNMYFLLDKNDLLTTKRIREYPGEYTEYRSFGFCYQPFVYSHEMLHFGAVFTDTIFSYKNDTIAPYITIKDKENISQADLERKLVKSQYQYLDVIEEMIKEDKYNTGILNYFENKRYILCDFRTKTSPRKGILWDKEKNEGVYIDKYLHPNPDLSLFISTTKNTVIRVWNNIEIQMFKDELYKDKYLEDKYTIEVINFLREYDSEEDNPALILYEFRED